MTDQMIQAGLQNGVQNAMGAGAGVGNGMGVGIPHAPHQTQPVLPKAPVNAFGQPVPHVGGVPTQHQGGQGFPQMPGQFPQAGQGYPQMPGQFPQGQGQGQQQFGGQQPYTPLPNTGSSLQMQGGGIPDVPQIGVPQGQQGQGQPQGGLPQQQFQQPVPTGQPQGQGGLFQQAPAGGGQGGMLGQAGQGEQVQQVPNELLQQIPPQSQQAVQQYVQMEFKRQQQEQEEQAKAQEKTQLEMGIAHLKGAFGEKFNEYDQLLSNHIIQQNGGNQQQANNQIKELLKNPALAVQMVQQIQGNQQQQGGFPDAGMGQGNVQPVKGQGTNTQALMQQRAQLHAMRFDNTVNPQIKAQLSQQIAAIDQKLWGFQAAG